MSTNPVVLPVLRKSIDTVVEMPQILLPHIDARAALLNVARSAKTQAYPFALGLGLTLIGRAIATPMTAGYPLLSHLLGEEEWDGEKPTARQFAKFYATYAIGVTCAYAPEFLSTAQRFIEQ